MSNQVVDGSPSASVGFYGKFPVRGDFVTRHLTMDFIKPWDDWLQSAIAASREQMGEAWLETYLTSPLWRFVLSSGLCGVDRWAGVMMPSVDRVGRYFPLTIVSTIDGRCGLSYLMSSAGNWFHQIEELALTALENDFDLGRFESALAKLPSPQPLETGDGASPNTSHRDSDGKPAFQVGMKQADDLSQAFAGLSEKLLEQYVPSFSLWNTIGSEQVEGSLIACQGLPPVDAFSSFLDGSWHRHGWNIRTGHVQVFDVPKQWGTERNSAVLGEHEEVADGLLHTEPLPQVMHWTSYGETDVGRKRKINEDAFLLAEEQGLWVVADGMGGHKAGDLASKMVTEKFVGVSLSGYIEEAVTQTCEQLKRVNQELYLLAAEEYDHQVVGSTVVVLIGRGDRCGFVWAGDSRIYRLRKGRLSQLSRDHALLDDEVEEESTYSEDATSNFEHSNVITRAVGAELDLDLDSEIIDVEDGDAFLLCSDGLTKEVSTTEVASLLSEGTPQECVKRLMNLALERGARDNVTTVVVQARK